MSRASGLSAVLSLDERSRSRRPRPIRLRLAAALLLLTRLAAPAQAQADNELATDGERSAFAQRREVALTGAAGGLGDDRPGFAELPLPPELAGSSEPPYHDLRLLRSDGREVPYLLAMQTERHEVETTSGELTSGLASGTGSVWVVDFLQPRSFDALELQVDGERFAKQVTVEGATERSGPFRTLRASTGIFDLPWSAAPGFRVRHTGIEWEEVQTARYVRITVNDLRSRPIELRGVTALRNRAVKAQMWTRPAPLVALTVDGRKGKHTATRSRYRLDLPAGLPIEQVVLRAEELAFVRPVRLLELPAAAASRSGPEASAAEERELASDTLYRLATVTAAPPPGAGRKHHAAALRPRPEDESQIDPQLAAELLTLHLSQPPAGGTLVLEIDNGDSPPLSGLQVEVYGCGARLIFEYPGPDAAAPALTATRKWALYYGNPAARAPHYDLEALRERLTRLGPLRPARLLAERPNPRYHRAPPLQFVPTVGAPLASQGFRLQQALRVPDEGGPDIYAVSLDPVAVGLLRPDLGDVRIVDRQERQVPYVLSADAGEGRAELTRLAEPRPRLSRYRLSFRGAGDSRPLALPLWAVELFINDPFYNRAFRLLGEAAEPEDGAPRLLLSGTLRRRGEDGGGLHRLPLSGERRRELILEIDDEDNPPLTIERIGGVVRTPRLAFKLTPGEGYRLLLGDPDASPPRYDIETLRQAVLDYAALPAQLGPLEPNRAYRSRARDYLLHAPPTAVLWGALLLAVAVLLAITVRLLGRLPSPE